VPCPRASNGRVLPRRAAGHRRPSLAASFAAVVAVRNGVERVRGWSSADRVPLHIGALIATLRCDAPAALRHVRARNAQTVSPYC
jgi:hypothetical protein